MAWTWTKQKEDAAALVAADDLTDQAIADAVGVTKRSLERWKQFPEFSERVASLVEAWHTAVRNRGIAVIENRVRRLDRTRTELLQVVEERKAAAVEQERAHNLATKELDRLRGDLTIVELRMKDRTDRPGFPDEIEEARAAEDVAEAKRLRNEIDIFERADPGPLIPGQRSGQVILEVVFSKAGRREKWAFDPALAAELDRLEEQAAREMNQRVDRREVSGPGGAAIPVTFADALDKVYGDPVDSSG